MQTFLPYSDFQGSAACLDRMRLGKQRVECMQILSALRGNGKGWGRHPAALMWAGHEDALEQYMRCCIMEWIGRGYKNTIAIPEENWDFVQPWWLGDMRFHLSHRSNLIRKLPDHYTRFGWDPNPDLPYFWPTKELSK